ncbi:hypothetical protein HPB47_023668, partial [Ixodes persulcatus]
YTVKDETSPRGRSSTLKIRTADRSDSATFSCTATNPYGKDSGSSRVIIQEVPDPPEDVRIGETTSNVVSLIWTAPYSGNSPITSYAIVYQANGKWSGKHDHEPVRRLSVPGGLTTASVTNLQPLTEYQFKVVANNDIGTSTASKVISVTTNMEAPQEAPSQVSAAALDSNSIKLSWRKPHHDHKNMQISGYYVGYKTQGTSEPFIYKTVEADGKGVKEEFIIGGLQKNTKYVIVVQAFNGQGAGPAADEIVVKTHETDPPRSPLLRIIATTSTSVHVRWEPADKDSVVTGYLLHYKHAGSEWKKEQLHSYQTNKILDGLLCGTPYQLFLTAFNDIGTGEPSPVVEVTTEGKTPVAPPSDSFVSANMSSASVQLRAWSDGGCPIRHFVLQYKQQNSRDWIMVSNYIVPEQQVVQLSDLSPGTWHDLLAIAHNDAGHTEADYQFATLTLRGATVPPPSAGSTRQASMFEDPALLVPVLCAAVVLVVVVAVTSVVVVWRRRGDSPADASSDNCDMYSRASPGKVDDICLSTYGKAKGDGMYDSQRASLYYPSPYATSHVAFYGGTGRSGQEELSGTLQRASRGHAKEHTYDVPHRLKIRALQICDQGLYGSVVELPGVVWTLFGRHEVEQLKNHTTSDTKVILLVPVSTEQQRTTILERLQPHIIYLSLVRMLFVLEPVHLLCDDGKRASRSRETRRAGEPRQPLGGSFTFRFRLSPTPALGCGVTVTILACHDHSSDYDERLRTFGWHRLSHRRTVARVRLVAVAAGLSLAGSDLTSVPRISSRTGCPILLRTCTRRHEASLFPSA